MDASFLAFGLVIFASFFQGSFGLGMKYMAPLKWEAWWLVHASVAMLAFPLIWAVIAVPGLFEIIGNAPANAIAVGSLFGFLWGIGGFMFGISVPYIGISLTYGIVMGLASAAGSLIPLFQMENASDNPAFPIVITGVLVMLIGVAITAYAGVKRDRIRNSGAESNSDTIVKGIVLASICGLLSSLLNVGFANAAPVAKAAQSAGIITRNSSLAAWVVVLAGAFLMNAGYAVYLLIKNKSFASFKVAKSGKAYMWAIVAGIFWFAALGIYGQGSALLGEIGPVIGWPILLGLSLIFSNIWGYVSGEWKNAMKPFRILLMGVAILIIASIILGYANSVII